MFRRAVPKAAPPPANAAKSGDVRHRLPGPLVIGSDPATGQPYTYAEARGLVTIAAPGSGKTQCHMLPNLRTWRGPAIVLDVTGELWAKTSGTRSGFGPVYRFDLDHPELSDSYNPFTFIRRDDRFAWGDAQTFAALTYTKQTATGGDGGFFDLAAVQYIAAVACFVARYTPAPLRNFETMLAIVSGEKLDDFLTAAAQKREIPGLVNAAATLKRSDDRTKGNVIWTARNCLSPWEDPMTAEVSRVSDWHPDVIRKHNGTVYICLSLERLMTHPALVRLLIGQHLRAFMRTRVDETTPWVQFFIDETPQLRNMDVLVQAIEAGRNFRLRVWMVMQWKGQLEEAYGEKTATGMIAACGLQAFLNPSLYDGLATSIAEQIGYFEHKIDKQRRYLYSPQVLAGPLHQEDVIAFDHGTMKFLTKRYDYDDPASRNANESP